MTAFLSQINRLNPHLNAIVAKLDDDACLALADEADRALGTRRGRSVRCTACPPRSRISNPRSDFRSRKGSPIFKDVMPDRGLGARRAHSARRRDSDRQDQRARVRHGLADLQQRLRHDAQSVRSHQDARADRAAAPARRWPRACCRSPMAAISAARCAIRPTSTTSSRCGRASAWCRMRRCRFRSSACRSKGAMARSVSDVALRAEHHGRRRCARSACRLRPHPQRSRDRSSVLQGRARRVVPGSRRPAARSARAQRARRAAQDVRRVSAASSKTPARISATSTRFS